ncbi:MAG: hypothetical protein JWM41_995 [Gemmatimonadetes bacterium]|nr:hypothetical protein [Gemmatimonadota bacterium]
MAERNVKDSAGRTWVCTPEVTEASSEKMGRDIALSCTTSSVAEPVALTVGWQWAKMSDSGLGRLIAAKAPVGKSRV